VLAARSHPSSQFTGTAGWRGGGGKKSEEFRVWVELAAAIDAAERLFAEGRRRERNARKEIVASGNGERQSKYNGITRSDEQAKTEKEREEEQTERERERQRERGEGGEGGRDMRTSASAAGVRKGREAVSGFIREWVGWVALTRSRRRLTRLPWGI